ncbi:MAG: peptidylprolyl isomerase [Terracidiphilus sp.]|nr:peptidylprolyl isomerase [Terracidiphilus sp.]MDR3797319.1 peptidylprolyl isomerase [Terracidiphilus sp.]
MIRFLQSDNRITKALFVVVIGAASVAMVVYLIPGLTGAGAAAPDTFAVVYPHWYSKILSSGDTISQTRVQQVAENELRQRGPQYAGNPMIVQYMEQQVGQEMVQQKVLLQEAHKLGVYATDDDVRQYLRTGPTGQVIYPDGKFIGEEAYKQLVDDRLHISVDEFENQIKEEITVRRLQALITAGVTVSDQEVRDLYRKANIKIKFDYAVISADDLRKTINPSDSDLEAFFKKNAAQYAQAVPEERRITYFAFTQEQVPGGVPQPSQQQIQQYYNDHSSDYSVPDQAKSRHILISVPEGADAKADAAAKAKAESVLKQLQAGGSWTDLAKKYSDDPGSKDTGGELGFAQRGKMVPEFDKAIFTQKIGDIAIVKSSFGYHIIQVEERQSAHTQPLSEVQANIVAAMTRDAAGQTESRYAEQLTAEANKNGLEKTAAAHHLQLVNSQPVGRDGVIAALPDSSQLLAKAFAAKQGDPPQSAPTGEGYAIFQVTGEVAAHAPAFADWKTHVLDDYRDEQLPALLGQKTKDLADKAKAMNDLGKAAKAVGATVKTSDLVDASGQVPDFGEVAQVAPQLFEMTVGSFSGPINAGRTGVVVKILDKQEPNADEIAKNFDRTRDQVLQQKRNEAFSVFMSGVWDNYKKHNLIRFNAKPQQTPGT